MTARIVEAAMPGYLAEQLAFAERRLAALGVAYQAAEDEIRRLRGIRDAAETVVAEWENGNQFVGYSVEALKLVMDPTPKVRT